VRREFAHANSDHQFLPVPKHGLDGVAAELLSPNRGHAASTPSRPAALFWRSQLFPEIRDKNQEFPPAFPPKSQSTNRGGALRMHRSQRVPQVARQPGLAGGIKGTVVMPTTTSPQQKRRSRSAQVERTPIRKTQTPQDLTRSCPRKKQKLEPSPAASPPFPQRQTAHRQTGSTDQSHALH
jgi:hypothetical protein